MKENVLIAVFEVESEAYQAATELKNYSGNDDFLISQLALVKKVGGNVIPVDSFDTGIDTRDDTVSGALIGGFIGILGGPLGMLLGGSYGALIGSAFDADDASTGATLIEQVTTKMPEGVTAAVALVQEEDEGVLDSILSRFKTTIIRKDAAAVAEEVEEVKAVQKELQRQAREELRSQRKADREQRINERREKIKADFAAVKEKFK